MKTPRRQIAQIIARQATSTGLSKRRATAMAAYLLQTNRSHELAPLMRDVAREWLDQGRLEIAVVSAHPLTPTVSRDIRALAKRLYPKAKHITITSAVDSKLIGGVRARIGEYELDYSVSSRLNSLTATALKGVD